jgi:hypothetical protein
MRWFTLFIKYGELPLVQPCCLLNLQDPYLPSPDQGLHADPEKGGIRPVPRAWQILEAVAKITDKD